jgi:hypothetical protein
MDHLNDRDLGDLASKALQIGGQHTVHELYRVGSRFSDLLCDRGWLSLRGEQESPHARRS